MITKDVKTKQPPSHRGGLKTTPRARRTAHRKPLQASPCALPQATARRSVRWPIRRARRGELRASILLVQRTPLMPPHSSLQSRCLPGKAGNNTQTRQRAAKHAPRSASTSAPTCRRLAGSRLHAGLRSSPVLSERHKAPGPEPPCRGVGYHGHYS